MQTRSDILLNNDAIQCNWWLLLAGVIPTELQPCNPGVPSTDENARLWSFITIPLLSFLAFTFIIGCLLGIKRTPKNEKTDPLRSSHSRDDCRLPVCN
ncbi:MAG: hypothetical protein K2Y31_17430 [Burkholderiales bacterium]|jgi:hypothetical protein|nr:hypothetical protein [Burkholderiales bacterium]